MGLFSFFKKDDKVGKESTIASKEITGKTQLSSKSSVKTKLSFHPDWDVPQEQKYIFTFLANELAPLKPNQLSLAAINIEEEANTGKWNVKAFFRSSLSQAIELGEIELLILDAENNKLASKTFDFKELGTIPPNSARPWVFEFDRSSIEEGAETPGEGWQIAFNLISLRGHILDLHESWKEQLPKEQQEKLAEIVKTLPKLGKTEVNFTGLQLKQQDDNSLHVSIFIRNGNDKQINLEQLPLEIVDANGMQVAKGSFKMDPVLTVQANATRPWTFIFPSELVTIEGADLSRWTARVTQ